MEFRGGTTRGLPHMSLMKKQASHPGTSPALYPDFTVSPVSDRSLTNSDQPPEGSAGTVRLFLGPDLPHALCPHLLQLESPLFIRSDNGFKQDRGHSSPLNTQWSTTEREPSPSKCPHFHTHRQMETRP